MKGSRRPAEAATTQTLGGRYRLEGQIAAGGMGTVWAAHDETLDRRVAVKVLNESLAHDDRFVERFRREALAAAALMHPNIAGVFDYAEDDGRPYIVMELLDGETLAQRIGRMGALDPPLVVRIGADVADALAAAHEAGLVHRDVKPANVMLTERGDVKVMDFGIAASSLGGTGLTGTGMVMGTARYLSPEQAAGGQATPASDLYSLGAVLYEMLTGRPPFERKTPVATAMAHVNDTPTPVRDVRPDTPPELAALVDRCLEKDPAARPGSAADVAAALRAEGNVTPDADTAVLAVPGPGATLELPSPVAPPSSGPAAPGGRPTTRRLPPAWRSRRALLVAIAVAAVLAILLAILLSGGGGEVKVPAFRGRSRAQAVRLAERVGVHPVFVARESVEPTGTVIRQRPSPGTEVLAGSDVILVVSKGPATSAPAPSPSSNGGGGGDNGKGEDHGDHGKGKDKKDKGKGHGHGH